MKVIDYELFEAAARTVSERMDSAVDSHEHTRRGEITYTDSDALIPLMEQYGLDPDDFTRHIYGLIRELIAAGLVTHPMGASIVASKFILGVLIGMQVERDRAVLENPGDYLL